jgi:methylthioribose-1-phosphate isomerase
MTQAVQPIIWQQSRLRLLDQRRLPQSTEWVDCADSVAVAQAIHSMVVRGAPAIGIAAAYGLALDAAAGRDWEQAVQILANARPTAVNLHWAIARMQAARDAGADAAMLAAEACAIHEEDLAQNRRMAAHGAALLAPGSRVLTHCNTGALATGGHGTALGVIRTARDQGLLSAVYATETRPWLQGARLTAWELQQEGIDSTLIVDSAAALVMAQGRVDWVIVGADRIAANGDTANKIGTHTLACCARQYGVRFMVVAPSGTFDLGCADGSAIPVEERDPEELCSLAGQRIAPHGVRAFNPVFDVTPASLIDAIVCEHGVIQPVNAAAIRACLPDSGR